MGYVFYCLNHNEYFCFVLFILFCFHTKNVIYEHSQVFFPVLFVCLITGDFVLSILFCLCHFCYYISGVRAENVADDPFAFIRKHNSRICNKLPSKLSAKKSELVSSEL